MTSQLFIIGFCLLWILICGRMWWAVGRQHKWQRHLIAIGAGLGAALFYVLGTTVWDKLKPEEPSVPKTGDEVKISPRVSL